MRKVKVGSFSRFRFLVEEFMGVKLGLGLGLEVGRDE